MMIIINKTGSQADGFLITGSYNGKQFGVSFDEQKYAAMLALRTRADKASSMEELQSIMDEFAPLTEESYKDVVETLTPYIVVNKHTNKFYLKFGGKVSSEPLPKVFVDKILKLVDKQIDITPMIKCWARFMRPIPGRPVYSQANAKLFAEYIAAPYVNGDLKQQFLDKGLSDDVATQRATTEQVSITQEGLLVCYKVSKEILKKYKLNEDEDVITRSRYEKIVDEDTGLVTYKEPAFVEDRLFEPAVMGNDGDAFYSGPQDPKNLGHFIRVGREHWLDDWKKVSMPGCKGMHVGGLRYIAGYQQDGTVTHNIFVDPMDIYGRLKVSRAA